MANVLFPNGHALLIGIGRDLPVTIADANAIKDVLVNPNQAGYPESQVDLLTGPSATCQAIWDSFDRLITRLKHNPDATVIVYFSGHGGRIENMNAHTEYFLVPYDYDPARRAKTTISGIDFTKKIEAINSRKLIVILDCCHAGGIPALKSPIERFVKSPVPPNLLEWLDTGNGRVVIASSHEGEFSYTGKIYSVFTSCLIEALAGKASVSNDGYARILDILIYLFKHVPERAAGPQHPFVKKVLDLGDNFALCYYAGGGKHLTTAIPGDEIDTSENRVLPGKLQRLEKRRFFLQAEWELHSEKVRRLREALTLENDIATKFKLEKQVLNEEASLATLDGELDEIDRTLEIYLTAGGNE